MRRLRFYLLVVSLICSAGIVSAHHGKDFLLVESYDLPEPHEIYLVGSAAIATQDGLSLELEPSVLVGVLPRVAFELHSHIAKEPGENLDYEATAPALHFQLSPPESDFPIHFGFSAEYEIARNNDSDRFESRLIMETEMAHLKIVANLIGQHQEGGHHDAGYAIGARYDFTHQFAAGLEAEGPFTNDTRHELVIGAYFEPTESVTLKAGIGPTIDSEGTGFVARFGIVWRL